MQTNTLTAKSSRIRSPRVGRGGKRGKTSGRGTKGQKARAGRKMRPEMRDIIKKIPKRRGHGKNRSRTVRSERTDFAPVSLEALEKAFAANDAVTPAILVKKGIVKSVRGRVPAMKILGGSSLSKALSVSGIATSASAKAAIEAAGGSVVAHA